MADTKISALTAVTTPASTDEFAVNQAGTTKKMTRAQIHSLEVGENLVIPQENTPTDPTIKFGDGDSGIYESADDVISFAIAGANSFDVYTDGIRFALTTAPIIRSSAATGTSPTLCPGRNDQDTGIGREAADNLALICGGIQAVRVEDPADLAATETSLWLYDLDGAALKQVSVGANDSGGSGFKVLRVAN